jgi:mannose-6-phosphate isomerase
MQNNQIYPLKFKPIIKDPIWGGSKLRDLLNKKEATGNSGESWELSGVEGNISVVSEGFLEGNNLQEIIEVYMGDLVGQKVFEKFGTVFPLLIKFIDACDDLSIQVHPNDEIAFQRHNSFGKTEMWYVMQADKDSELIAGFNKHVAKADYLEHMKNNSLTQILNSQPVESGDVFFIPAGRIHAIGKGILLAEIQQTSNITYRVYDYNRTDANGKSRELHTEQAVDVIDYNYYKEYKTQYDPKNNEPVCLADCKYFTTNLLELSTPVERDMLQYDSFVIYMGIEGKAQIKYRNNSTTILNKGETILVPAEISQYYLVPDKEAKVLEIYMADKPADDETGIA